MTGIRAQKRAGPRGETYYSWQAYCRDRVVAISGDMYRSEEECIDGAIKDIKLLHDWTQQQALEVNDEAHRLP